MFNIRIIKLLILFIVIFASGGIPGIPNFILSVLVIILSLIVLIKKKVVIKKKYIFTYLTILFLLLLNFLFHFDVHLDNKLYLLFILYFTAALFVAFIYVTPENNFTLDFYLILKVICIYSIFSFFFQFLISAHLSIYEAGDYKAKTFYNLVFYPYLESDFYFLRNMGPFWEPGLLQFYTNLLFFCSVFVYRQTKWAILSAFIILTTFSTTGLIILIIQFAYIANAGNNLKDRILYFLLSMALIGSISVFFIDNIKSKFVGGDVRSSYGRIYDLETGLNLVYGYPVMGIGLSVEKFYKLSEANAFQDTELQGQELELRGNTNGFVKIFYNFGIPLGLAFIFMLYKQKLFIKDRKLFALILFITLFSEPISYTVFVFFIIFSRIFQSPTQCNIGKRAN